jgi:hypothetical protein
MRQLGRGPGNNLTHLQDVCRQAGEPCGETMGQLDCHTKPPSASHCATVQPDEYAPCNRTSQTVRRFAQTLMMYQRRTFLLLRSETFTEVAAQNAETDGRRLLSLQEILFRRKIGVSKKSKREVRHAKQGSDQTLPRRRRPHLSRPRQQKSGSLAQNLR